ncbi:hypothetical protein ASE25_12570 [Terrabacter sp. Root85]|nr:hypothetical protein ASE25_12570 [Terrabacter sp. Root85]
MRGLAAAATVVMMAGLAGCGDDDSGGGGGDAATDQACELTMSALASGLQEYSRTRAVGEFLSVIAKPASVPCRNAIANLASGRSATFDLLRPNGSVEPLDVSPQVFEPVIGRPGGADVRASRCAATFGTTWLYDSCVLGRIDPL